MMVYVLRYIAPMMVQIAFLAEDLNAAPTNIRMSYLPLKGDSLEMSLFLLRHQASIIETASKHPIPFSFTLPLACKVVASRLSAFHKLMTRGRKGVQVNNIKVNTCIFAFDLLYLNGQSLLQEQLKIRRKLLKDSFEVETVTLNGLTLSPHNNLYSIDVLFIKVRESLDFKENIFSLASCSLWVLDFMENERHVLTLNFSRREWRKRQRGLDYAGCTERDRMVWITREDEERQIKEAKRDIRKEVYGFGLVETRE
ncbi:hypothetical protein Cgig2_015010 [Carnegiea gigantea]|uniref:ATP-dependent DNA ligase family profile domain-containing protein n=1 Tax=Carnegiea gigantea TaxID=171969 RepID=A0A9Q1GL28_9CARY|nr:hypothetical protein Cgig2_015010 [Carnegiea gigantea]